MAQEIIGREPEIKEIEALYQTNLFCSSLW